jgi:A/G-specific adenine glycosylase
MIIHQEYNDEFPNTLEALENLPGIGRSTAGAILSIALQQCATILDGNVKRVLARYHMIDGWYGQSTVLKALWAAAEQHTPTQRNADYTQAIMDLGATVCTRSKPKCETCPLQYGCKANINSKQNIYPHKKPKKDIPIRSCYLLILTNPEQKLLLEKRPPSGIWGGLWCLPQYADKIDSISTWCQDEYQFVVEQQTPWPSFRHTFSHFHLDITPLELHGHVITTKIMEPSQQIWYNVKQPDQRGLAAPVAQILNNLVKQK